MIHGEKQIPKVCVQLLTGHGKARATAIFVVKGMRATKGRVEKGELWGESGRWQ